jgi:hypothetical protein
MSKFMKTNAWTPLFANEKKRGAKETKESKKTIAQTPER